MKKIDFWNLVKNSNEQWFKIPIWSIPLLQKISLSICDLWVFLFLIYSITDSIVEVNATTRNGIKFCCCTVRTYYKSINRLKQLGLKKTGNGLYDLTELIKTLSILSVGKNNIPLE